jgi:hypothetical protein
MPGMATMKKKIFAAIIFLAPLLMGSNGHDAKISWNLPTSYSDGTPIVSADVQKIVVKVYVGPSSTGPWKWIATSLPGATSASVIGPTIGQTLWYTVKSSLNDAESDYADPVSKTNLALLTAPIMKKVMKKMITPKKMIALLFLLLLIASGWLIWHRKRRLKGKQR